MKSVPLFIEIFLELFFSLIHRLPRLFHHDREGVDFELIHHYGLETNLHISEVTREFYFYDLDSRGYILALVSCPSFCVDIERSGQNRWSFIKRQERKYGEFPNGYTVVLRDGKISEDVWKILQGIASDEQLIEYNLELELFMDKVCAYTLQIPGIELVKLIHESLQQIQSATT